MDFGALSQAWADLKENGQTLGLEAENLSKHRPPG